jgi:hypothetical protein
MAIRSLRHQLRFLISFSAATAHGQPAICFFISTFEKRNTSLPYLQP